jgi:hypothetical protein
LARKSAKRPERPKRTGPLLFPPDDSLTSPPLGLLTATGRLAQVHNRKEPPVPSDSFELECDRLSQVVDNALFERLRWERTEGPMLAHLVAIAHGALEPRGEFELVEEGATRDAKRFVLKIHGNRVVAISIHVEDGRAVVEAHGLERTKYSLAAGTAATIDFEGADQAWMAGALQQQFGRVVLAA